MRNLLTILLAALRSRLLPTRTFECRFVVMPWDVGVATFKSDRYLAAAEAAQFDFVTRCGMLRPMLSQGVRWVNLGQASAIHRPLRLFQSFVVSTSVMCIDEKHAYFSHTFSSSKGEHARVLVKAKFKRGSLTVRPQEFLGSQPLEKSMAVEALDQICRQERATR